LRTLLVCYAIHSKNMFRFVTGWDVDRWGLTAEALDEQALANLARLPWPQQLMGGAGQGRGAGHRGGPRRQPGVEPAAAPSTATGSFPVHWVAHSWPAFPAGTGLVLYSNRCELKQRIGRRLKKDHAASAYPITPHPFLVTRDGIAPAGGK